MTHVLWSAKHPTQVALISGTASAMHPAKQDVMSLARKQENPQLKTASLTASPSLHSSSKSASSHCALPSKPNGGMKSMSRLKMGTRRRVMLYRQSPGRLVQFRSVPSCIQGFACGQDVPRMRQVEEGAGHWHDLKNAGVGCVPATRRQATPVLHGPGERAPGKRRPAGIAKASGNSSCSPGPYRRSSEASMTAWSGFSSMAANVPSTACRMTAKA